MPIHDHGYRRYAGSRARGGRAWLVVARAGIRALVTRRAFAALLIVSWLPCLVRAAQIYAAANIPQAQFLAPTAATFRQFLSQQEVFLFFVTVYAGAGLIANDRRAHALQIYLARPLTRVEYVGGKMATLVALVLFVTWVPAMTLLLVQVAFTGSLAFVLEHWFLVPALSGFCAAQALTVSVAMLALSSLSNSSRYVGVLYAALLVFTQALTLVLRAVTGHTRWAWLSVASSLEQLGSAALRQSLPYEASLAGCLATIALVVLAALFVLNRRIRGIEVVT